MSRCNECVTDRSKCNNCVDNPKYTDYPHNSLFMTYKPVCPRGYDDCVWDPAYIKFHSPNWYKDLYGEISPEEAIYEENGCYEKFINDPNEKYYCYDDEDK